jgi:putative peptidoglycan lipid II flippase
VSGQDAESEKRRITSAAGVVALGTLLSRLLGLARDVVLAAVFSRAATDAWLIAWQLPNLLRQILAEGAVQTAVLPVLTKVREEEGEEQAQRYFQALRGLSLCALLLVSLVGVLFAPALVGLFASGFRSAPEQFERTVTLTRWVFPYILFMGTTALGVAALNTHRRFVVTSFAPALLNLSFLACAFLLPGWLGAQGWEEIFAMAVGGLAGGALQLVAQWPSLKKIGYLSRPTFNFSHPAIKETLRRLAPTLLGVGVYAIDVMVGRRLLSELEQGSITYFTYAMRLCDFSQGIFVMAISTATLPALASYAARKEFGNLSRTFADSIKLALFVGTAATALSVALAEPLVTAAFQRGQFDAHATLETTRALQAQGLGIFLVAAVRQLVIVFFSLGRTMLPVYVAIVDLVVFFLLATHLRDTLGHVGVSYAVTGARVTQFILLSAALFRILPTLHAGEILVSATRSAAAALGAGIVAWQAAHVLPFGVRSGSLERIVPLATAGPTFIVAFYVLCKLLRCEELAQIQAAIGRKLRRTGK